MSLDLYLESEEEMRNVEKCSECGHEREVSARAEFFSWNITHNLGEMAEHVKVDGVHGTLMLYTFLWHPEELPFKPSAENLIKNGLFEMLKDLEARPGFFTKFDAPNGWGTYKEFVSFVRYFYEACLKYPNAIARASR
jgi:hypothetical protein